MLTPNSLQKEKDPSVATVTKITRGGNPAAKAAEFTQLELSFGSFSVAGRPGGAALGQEVTLIRDLQRQVAQLRSRMALLQKDIPRREEAAREAGREEGRILGRAEARRLARAEEEQNRERLQRQFTGVLRTWDQEKDKFFRQSEGIALYIIKQMVQMILHREITADPQTVITTLQAALKYASERTSLTIKVNPADYKNVMDRQSFWQSINSQLKTVQVVEDERVDAGGCVIDTGAGTVDARIGSQFQKLQEVLEQTFHKQLSDVRPQTSE